MTKPKQPPALPSFVLLREVLPDLVKMLEAELRKMGQRKLGEQLRDLRIYGRCPCERLECGTFYCVSEEEMKRLAGFLDATYTPVTIANGKIVSVETFDPKVAAVLRSLFPPMKEETV